MTTQDFDKVIQRRLDLINTVMRAKNKEYANDSDKFHNFKASTGISFHSAPEKIAWEFMTKHLQSIKDILDHVEVGGYNGYPTEALVEEKIGDAINYLILIEGMLKERIQNGQK